MQEGDTGSSLHWVNPASDVYWGAESKRDRYWPAKYRLAEIRMRGDERTWENGPLLRKGGVQGSPQRACISRRQLEEHSTEGPEAEGGALLDRKPVAGGSRMGGTL